MLGRSSPSQAITVNATATASAAAVHITRRYASTTKTYARADADVPPNANPSAATATRPPSRAAALFTPDAEPPRSQQPSALFASQQAPASLPSVGADLAPRALARSRVSLPWRISDAQPRKCAGGGTTCSNSC